jgi:UDP-N-acetylglucosamine--N-acetylmuramyl-(pentapeptide) pyrophosphoryl-undecaprenol N-acetylglucosamine transferase
MDEIKRKLRGKRFLFHAINGVGIGHLAREMIIADWLTALDVGCECLFLTEGWFGKEIADRGYAALRSPATSYVKTTPTEKLPPILDVMDIKTVAALASDSLRSTCRHFNPDYMVFDVAMPKVLYDAVAPGVKRVYVARLGRNVKNVANSNLTPAPDLVLVPNEKNQIAQYKSDLQKFKTKIVISGPIIRTVDNSEDKQLAVRERMGLLPGDNFLLITFGAGGWEYSSELLPRCKLVVEEIRQRFPGIKIVLSTGPLLRGKMTYAQQFADVVFDFDWDLQVLMRSAQAILTMGGYNSLYEVAMSGTPTIIFPAAASFDQIDMSNDWSRRFPQVSVTHPNGQNLTKHLTAALQHGGNDKPGQNLHASIDEAKIRTLRAISEIS